ncbi:DUF423 domain-containing protein [Acetobacter orleanensis]|uniref:Membrane protein n=1 Tax=Acetobacter orleanensis TaxID=104099 RepID=A0A4Y3TK36_9PROT|nr:DUF423 domain-containing protein [Acetobacter orleanensis]KXV62900.1 hypothetical protein AD949_09135 [Acetobacter orleanensis]PCD80678.1 DUF423 domain-containing protein [Acetobacter orleanensis]GAN67974.1 hypothetical protein Abol_014_025 [Acetobacter orleanensis JCM 7639]GBR27469.1 hypothetical protein AA0473_1447 [Acetobacter orleanensis NRIC 0473]GEB82104.1 membrane protein [Acetobacter orleanensis]
MLSISSLPRSWRVCGALLAGSGVILGALIAHLPEADFGSGGRLMAHGAMEMQMWHGLALLMLGLTMREKPTKLLALGGCGLLLGTLLFCGGVYYTAFTGQHAAHVAPTGGSILILSWLTLAIGWLRA